MRTLVVLPYFERPRMVENALRSLVNSTSENWDLAFIDDGSRQPGAPIVERILKDVSSERVTVYRAEDTIEEKQRRGSRHGMFMNQVIRNNTTADLVITLCDDDALIEDYLENLEMFFTRNPAIQYAYSHVRIFDPFREKPDATLPKRPYFTNVEGLIHASCVVDSSQVAYRRSCHQYVQYSETATKDLDAGLFLGFSHVYGPCHPTGFDGQYKAIFSDQLGQRKNLFDVKDLPE